MDEQRAEFEAWAKDKGCDTAHTYDTERNKWVFFNPMTADLWITWQAATQRQQERIAEIEAQVQALNAMKLDKPAQVGGGVFGVGVSVQHVIRAAQRHYEYQSAQAVMTQEQRVDEERKRRAFWDLIHGPLDAAIAAGKGEG